MRNHFISAVLIAAMALPCFMACENKEIQDLGRRVDALEGAWYQVQEDLKAAVVTGATIVNASQQGDIWTLVLSDGKVITINMASNQSQGSNVTVVETADAFIITVNSNSYTIPKVSSAAVNSLVFADIYGDGKVIVTDEGGVAYFLATPSFQASEATFAIADAREIETRAGDNLFKIESAENDGDLIKVAIKAISAESQKNYTVALKVTVQGTTISSNYFTVAVGENNFEPEALEDPVFADGIDAVSLGTGIARAQLPDDKADFLGTFNFKDLFQNLPSNATFQLGPIEEQNAQAQNRYDFFASCLASDGTWTMQGRPGNSAYDPENDGLLVYVLVNDQIKHKIYWKVYDPIREAFANYDRADGNPLFNGDIQGVCPEVPVAQHMEYRPMVPAGVNKIGFMYLFMNATPGEENDFLWFQHGDAPKTIEKMQNLEVTAFEPGDIIYNDGENLALGELGQKMARHSRGIWWQSTQPSIVSSQRDNLNDEQKQAVKDTYHVECNGEIINGYDGNGDANDFLNSVGAGIDPAGYFVTGESYTGTAFRFGVGLRYEYAYGQLRIPDWHLMYIFFNRRVAPEGAVDPQPK